MLFLQTTAASQQDTGHTSHRSSQVCELEGGSRASFKKSMRIVNQFPLVQKDSQVSSAFWDEVVPISRIKVRRDVE